MFFAAHENLIKLIFIKILSMKIQSSSFVHETVLTTEFYFQLSLSIQSDVDPSSEQIALSQYFSITFCLGPRALGDHLSKKVEKSEG